MESYVVLEVKPCTTFGKVATVRAEYDTKHPAVVLEDALNNMLRTGFSTAAKGTVFTTCKKSSIDRLCENCGIHFAK